MMVNDWHYSLMMMMGSDGFPKQKMNNKHGDSIANCIYSDSNSIVAYGESN